MKKITYLIVVVFLLVLIIPSKIEAKTLQDMYDQLADLQTKYNNIFLRQ